MPRVITFKVIGTSDYIRCIVPILLFESAIWLASRHHSTNKELDSKHNSEIAFSMNSVLLLECHVCSVSTLILQVREFFPTLIKNISASLQLSFVRCTGVIFSHIILLYLLWDHGQEQLTSFQKIYRVNVPGSQSSFRKNSHCFVYSLPWNSV